MTHKTLTQRYAFLLPIRKAQRKLFFYTRMKFDTNSYSKTILNQELPYTVFESKSLLLNDKTGFDMKYQENKVYNLKLATDPIQRLIIKPGEVYSFWKSIRYAEKNEKYKDGLVLQDGKLITESGGGLCQLSNLLYWMFLHSPLDTLERHPHRIKMFPPADPNELHGVDATISEGWLDLKVKNNTRNTYQMVFEFEKNYLVGKLLCEKSPDIFYKIKNTNRKIIKEEGELYETVTVIKEKIDKLTGAKMETKTLNTDKIKIGYATNKEEAV